MKAGFRHKLLCIVMKGILLYLVLLLYLLLSAEEQTDISAVELSKKRTALAGFCKLIAYNMIDMKLVAPVFSFLIKVWR